MQRPDTHPDAETYASAPDLLLRAPRAEDLAAITAIDASWGGVQRGGYLESRLKRALRPSGISLSRVATSGEQLVGFLLGEVTRGEFGRAGSVAWVDTIGVERAHVRQGVGTVLIEDFILHARMIGAARVATMLEPEDEALCDFLERHGFTVARTRVVERNLK